MEPGQLCRGGRPGSRQRKRRGLDRNTRKPERFRAKHALGLDPGGDAGSRKETCQHRESGDQLPGKSPLPACGPTVFSLRQDPRKEATMVTVLENRIPPPIVMVVTGLAMWAVSWVTSTVHIPAGIRYGVVGVLLVFGVSVAGLAVSSFRRAGTTIKSGQDRQRLVAGDDRHLRVHTQSHVCRTDDAACHPRGAAVERLAAARPVVFRALYHALPDHSGRARDAGQVRFRIRRLQGSRPALALRTRRHGCGRSP